MMSSSFSPPATSRFAAAPTEMPLLSATSSASCSSAYSLAAAIWRSTSLFL
uniref:Uncharacterized protein n=1 Tax=Arundo donax TaxID=35708 RepID=A0A0A9FH89_ARUDO